MSYGQCCKKGGIMAILITGGAGYIGSQLMRDLAADPRFQGQTVRILDNMFREKFVSYWDLPKGVTFEAVDGDIRKEEDLERAFRDVTLVFDLAGITNAPLSFERKELTKEVNVDGARKVLEHCVKNKAFLVYASSASVYGPTKELVDESYPCNPASPYGSSKIEAEKMILEACKTQGLKAVILRLGTVYGWSIGMRFDTVVDRFTYFACLGQPLTVWESALQEARPYAHIRDVTASLLFVANNDKMNGEIYNVISANCGIQEVVDAIKKHKPGAKSIITKTPNLNQLSYRLNSDKIKKEGFVPKYSMEDGVREMIEKFNGIRQME